jgi:hypothetical protein
MTRGRRPGASRRERGAALVLAILVLAILTVVGIALMLVTSTEARIAANEWSVNRSFYAADAGVRWASVEILDPRPFLGRPEYTTPSGGYPNSPFGTVLFQMPSHRNTIAGFFTGEALDASGQGTDVNVRVQNPSLLGRAFAPGGRMNESGPGSQYMYGFEVRTTAGDNLQQYSKGLQADMVVGPLSRDALPF